MPDVPDMPAGTHPLIWLAAIIALTTPTMVMTIRTSRATAKVASDAAAVRDSTVNDHDRPMRYDVDDVLAELRVLSAGMEELRAEGTEMRGEVTELRAEVRRSDARTGKALRDIDERTARIGTEVREDRQYRRDGDARIAKNVSDLQERVTSVISKYHPEELA